MFAWQSNTSAIAPNGPVKGICTFSLSLTEILSQVEMLLWSSLLIWVVQIGAPWGSGGGQLFSGEQGKGPTPKVLCEPPLEALKV